MKLESSPVRSTMTGASGDELFHGEFTDGIDLSAISLLVEELPESLAGSCAGSFFCGGSFSSISSCGSSLSSSSSFSSATG